MGFVTYILKYVGFLHPLKNHCLKQNCQKGTFYDDAYPINV